jgi:phage gp37-like protein
MHMEKSMYLITALQGRATNMLHRILKGNKDILEAVKDLFRDQHLAAMYHSQLKTFPDTLGRCF